jgi:hypothetical protein
MLFVALRYSTVKKVRSIEENLEQNVMGIF